MEVKKFKILFVLTSAFNPNAGGVQQTTFKLGKYFTENGNEVSYFSLADQGKIHAEYGELNTAKYPNGQNNPKNINDLKEYIGKLMPDFVINQMPYEKYLRNGLFEAKQKCNFILLGCLRNSLFSFKSNPRDISKILLPGWLHPFIDTVLGEKILQWRHWLKHRGYLKAIIDKHDRFILLAPPNREELKYFVGNYKAEKILLIPNSIPKVFEGPFNKEKIILHVGRIDIAQKRSDLLLDFWQEVYTQLPDWKFVIIGDGPYFPQLQSDLIKRGLPRIELLGNQKPDEYYKKSAIFMMPSAYEGFPNTILEAQSNGCIALAFNSYAALNWIVNNGKDTFLIKPYDVKQMANHAIELAKNNLMQQEMQTFALENAHRFTINKVGLYWLELFKSLK